MNEVNTQNEDTFVKGCQTGNYLPFFGCCKTAVSAAQAIIAPEKCLDSGICNNFDNDGHSWDSCQIREYF